jgi:hypothetical protein
MGFRPNSDDLFSSSLLGASIQSGGLSSFTGGLAHGIHGQNRLHRPYLESSPGLLAHRQQPHTKKQHVTPSTKPMIAIDMSATVSSEWTDGWG